MQDELKSAEASGRGGDSFLGHLSPGDTVIPRGMMKPEWRDFLQNHFDVDVYTVGNERNSLNPFTGLPEFYDGAGGYDSVTAEADSGKEGMSGLGANPGQNGSMSAFGNFIDSLGFGITSAGHSIGRGIGDILGAPFGGSFIGRSSAGEPGYGTGNMSGSGGDNSSDYANPLQAAAAQVAPLSASSVAPLPNPMTPNVPDSVPQLGEYYNLLRQGNAVGAENMLSRFMRGDSNVYGR